MGIWWFEVQPRQRRTGARGLNPTYRPNDTGGGRWVLPRQRGAFGRAPGFLQLRCRAYEQRGGYDPGSGLPSDERQAFYGDIAVRTEIVAPRSIASFIVDASTSAGEGVRALDRPAGTGRSFEPIGVRHVNPAGRKIRESL